ncbi:MAG: hypothetical protein ACYDH6_19220 [Acidimicrobiales bacterium]
MATTIQQQVAAGKLTLRIEAEVSVENVVELDLTVVDADGEVKGDGQFRMPLTVTRTFRDAFVRVLDQVATVPPHKAYAVGELRQTTPKSHASWTPVERDQLAEEFAAGMREEEMTQRHDRSRLAIRSQLHKQGLLADWRLPEDAC